MILGPLVVAVQGFSSPEMAANIERAQELCRRAGETPETFGVMFGLWSFNHASGNLHESRVIAEQLLAMAARMKGDLATAGAHNVMAATQLWMGEFPAAREHFEIATNIFDRDIPRYLPSMQAPVIPSRCHLRVGAAHRRVSRAGATADATRQTIWPRSCAAPSASRSFTCTRSC